MALQDITEAKAFLGCYIQRFSSTFGLNASPTTIELILIEGSPNSSDDSAGTYTDGIPVTGFDFDSALPGKMSGLSWGAFNFAGIIQSWEENVSQGGKTYSVKLSDPRIIFNNVQVILDGDISIDKGYLASGVTNYFDPLHAFGDRVSADINDDGINFHKVREYLQNSGIIHAYGSTFSLRFASGFLPSGIPINDPNPSGIPRWYRLPAAKMTLDQVLAKVSSDFNLDYYVNLDFNAFVSNPTGTIPLDIKLIDRTDATGAINDIQSFIDSAIASGTRVASRRGQELRNEPTTVVTLGPNKRFWQTPSHTTDQMTRFWGRSNAGFAMTTDVDSGNAVVSLDHIVGDASAMITQTVPITGRVFLKSPNPSGELYPPKITVTSSGENIKGYMPNDVVLRAALYNQESWEAILWNEDESFASQIGVSGRVRTRAEYAGEIVRILTENPNTLGTLLSKNIPISIQGAALSDRDDVTGQLITAIFEATKNTAEEFYGKQWLAKLGNSDWIRTTTFYGTDLIQPIEFDVADSAFSQGFGGGAYPDNITNHELLHRYGNTNFRDNLGRIKPFLSLNDYNDITNGYIAGVFPFAIDTQNIPSDEMFIEQGNKLVIPIEIEQFDQYPASGIVTTRVPLEGLVSNTGFNDTIAFHSFMKEFGYTDRDLSCSGWDLINRQGDNNAFGLGPPRVPYILSVEGNYGIHIPIVSNIRGFGPFFASGERNGGTTIMQDSSLAPWTFGSNTAFADAGQQTADRAVSTSTVVDSADLDIAGIPEYNIGDPIGQSSKLTGLSVQISAGGLTTKYSIKTFALPPSRLSKLLQDRILGVIVDEARTRRELIKINKKVKITEQKIRLASDVRKAGGRDGTGSGTSKDGSLSNVEENFEDDVEIIDPSGESGIVLY